MRVKMFIQLILGGLLVYLLVWRWQVATTRFFDVDEFSYLHWAAELVKGRRPYIDFFMFFTPGFLWMFAPIIKAYWMSAQIFVAARVIVFFIFLGILGGLGILWGKTRGWKWALLPVVILAFLPMPYDKFLEIRPDNLATLLALIGLIWEILGIREGKKSWWFWSGFFYAASLLVFMKTLPFVLVGCCVTLFVKTGRKTFFFGFAIPLCFLFVWMTTLGDFAVAWYSLTRLPFEANTTGKFEVMEPHLFFFPNISFYGEWGMTWGLVLNHMIWLMGITMGVIRFFIPFVTAHGDKKRILIEVLIAAVFVLSVFGYVQFFPLKHSQYLIPIAVFIAYYCADMLLVFGRKIGRIKGIGKVIRVAGIATGVWLLGVATQQINRQKIAQSNAFQLTQMRTLIKHIPVALPVLDIEGRMLFWPDAYDICCVPFGKFTRFMTRRPPALSDVLEKSSTPYIFQGETGRLDFLSWEDQTYIQKNYTPVEGWGESLWIRRDINRNSVMIQ